MVCCQGRVRQASIGEFPSILREDDYMGGQNCNCSGVFLSKLEASDEITKSYVTKLARYSGLLFGGVAKFYEAHAAIERSVQTNTPTLQTAVDLLSQAESWITEAKLSLGTVAALHDKLDATGYNVDFAEQQNSLNCSAFDISASRELLKKALRPSSISIQLDLWQTPNLTQTFSQAMSGLAAAISWQQAFATKTRTTLLTVA